MKKVYVLSTLGVIAVVAVAASVFALTRETAEVPADEIVPELASQQDSSDVLPDYLNREDSGDIVEESVRSAGSDERADYWVARTRDDEICLVVRVRGDQEIVSSSCGTPANIYERGAASGTMAGGSNENAVEAYLIPHDVDASQLEAELPDSRITSTDGFTLAVRFPGTDDRFSEATIDRSGGGSFSFIPLSALGG
ncbi:hypothetical protein M4I32_14945 [Microbacterium sp. LRZ72]|uniref:hypothetical protein n=1 Tax=Microbacterium sp. LRZ72 TaxID=2942481 RepID=UPI0029AE960E|nr:hypothetical protein [Microbacterium sp. LRZ72]MDX2378087.1 hypothetical protein [Microbacterium sp. LRZ72]